MDEVEERKRPLATEEFLTRVGDALLHEVLPWRNVWCIAGGPRNIAGDSRYQGVNRLHLSLAMADRRLSDPRFLTRKQVEERGYELRENARPTHVCSSRYQSSSRNHLRGEKRTFVHTLYNAEDVEGVPPHEPQPRAFKACDAVARLVHKSRAAVCHSRKAEVPHYDVTTDTIVMPTRDRFVENLSYDAALLHQLVHATGHGTREGRFEVYNDRDDLAVEELRAEIATVFLGQDLGIPLSARHSEEHDRHVSAWGALLGARPTRFLRCVHEAERIAAHVLGMDRELAKQVGRAGAAERLRAQRLPASVLRAAEGVLGSELHVIAPRKDFSEYIGPVVAEHEGFVFQRINDRYGVAHQASVPDLGPDRIWSICYRDRAVEVSGDLGVSTRSATREEVAGLREELKDQVSARTWRAAFTRHNQYVGVLEHVGVNFALQRTNRGALVVHRRDALGPEAEQGARLRIRYENHVAEVSPAPKRLRRGRAHDMSRGR